MKVAFIADVESVIGGEGINGGGGGSGGEDVEEEDVGERGLE